MSIKFFHVKDALEYVISTKKIPNRYQAACFLEVSPPLVTRVLDHGKDSIAVHNAIARKTGLLEVRHETEEVAVCDDCGEVHAQYSQCDEERKENYRRR